ncbi:RagB/SusD family nutrient uptake outer membrane protein [Pseudobacter ginsenosidimutans]|uniref:Putative outer membrane starch-binding protein n=1 Tax=Pseudobacter ginsenosidimutans TaxID=661488 RepID=A0A4Q7MUH7_9BACT|nr:RagB/SusD family nutrient uptake outer membrane protein [Pseudobacter ginsenosidimutans]QEC42440.1 RagB/SusD family nutrient uptake outer membrane protein [Pseudobacter ginsenosidimutans]RZS70710.1 putative outer membrane starch-binding protein [Pseudobacter ginsenosidimutans]
MKKMIGIVLASSMLMGTACKKYLTEDVVSSVSYQLYTTEKGIEGALVSAYNTLRQGVTSERKLTLSDAGTDLFTLGSDGNAAFNQYLATLSSLEGKLTDFWDYHYKGISECNVIMTYLPKVPIADARKAVIEGEAKFLRALYYFDLVQQYGNIPLVLESFDKVKTDFKRAPVKDVYEAIIADLKFAFENLPATATAQGRCNKAAAAHLLSKVYLTRGSAVSPEQRNIRGTQTTDLDDAITYAGKIVNKELGTFSLVADFAKLWDINNQVNSEVIFAVQFTTTQLNNGSGNQQHLYHVPQYDAINTRILARSIEYGRPYRRVRPTPFVYDGLFGATRKYDSRFVKSFVWGYIANKAATGIVTTAGNTINVAVGDTALYFSPIIYATPAALADAVQEHKRFALFYPQNTYAPVTMNNIFPGLRKWLDPTRPTTNETNGSRDWVIFRYAETLLILAEAYGRKGEFDKAVPLINQVRERAAYKENEAKTIQYWTFEGGSYADRTKSTVVDMRITESDINTDFVDFMLDERGRELLGELSRWEDLVRCEKLKERVEKYNPDAQNIRDYHNLRPIPQTHIDRLDPRGPIEEEQNIGYY